MDEIAQNDYRNINEFWSFCLHKVCSLISDSIGTILPILGHNCKYMIHVSPDRSNLILSQLIFMTRLHSIAHGNNCQLVMFSLHATLVLVFVPAILNHALDVVLVYVWIVYGAVPDTHNKTDMLQKFLRLINIWVVSERKKLEWWWILFKYILVKKRSNLCNSVLFQCCIPYLFYDCVHLWSEFGWNYKVW